MGRHRRSDAGRAATGRATGVTETHGSYPGDHDPWDAHPRDHDDRMGIAPYLNPDLYADAHARAQEYLFTTDDDHAHAADTVAFPAEGFNPSDGPRGPGHRRKKKAATPVRTGLLGVSAAVALGTVAVATGAVPGLENYKLGGGSSGGADLVQAADAPTSSESPQGGTSGSADAGSRAGGSSTSRGAERAGSPTPSAPESASASAPDTASPSATPTRAPAEEPTAAPDTTAKPETTPAGTATEAPAPGGAKASAGLSKEAVVEAEVLRLVNEERARAGCTPVAASSALTGLAEDFSKAMAEGDFFDHTDPSGASPWDRAAKAGITNLGGENIARGQADAAAVMEAWMNSPGHRANILNCDFKTLGVGVHFGAGGPWWTQNFGY
ncbi:CAP domain-containing protein [Streptomyces kebangsaanensis]|uniref:CAP domain-containing protein n=1 Tax=Streptomyces kebangsaanensis TaxID=864058 RepID=UPI00093D6ED3|nr:CAP domain-containing protein [Streptomyces kebangsaanensis]